MLPSALRLHRTRFAPTIRRGVRAGRDTVLVHAHPAPGTPDCRVGFVVSKAVGGAVARNQVRRRLRGVIVEHRGDLPAGVDLVVRALPPAATADYATLSTDLLGAVRAVGRRLETT